MIRIELSLRGPSKTRRMPRRAARSRADGLVEVDVTRRKNVRKTKAAGPGMVAYPSEWTIAVRPQDDAALKAE
jgi:predicted ribosome quality control (RQC) complex YloA/Tae2 family protein